MDPRVSGHTATLRPATSRDFDSLVELLETAALPTAGLPPTLGGFFVAQSGGRVVGGIGLEVYGRTALLRSTAVDPGFQGAGIGQALVRRILDHAGERGVTEVFLLTTTAERFFLRLGFTRIARSDVPGAVTQSVEFRGACPASAIAMRTELSTS